MKKKDEREYAFDVAISLCKEDVDFASKLVKALNPNLKVFFYADRQQELVSKSGPTVFAKTFKEDSRVVVILSRKEWSKSVYTQIEQNAIVDRTTKDGHDFLMVIPMVPRETPPWYPETYIYVSVERFPVDEIARFIEFKVSEEGGNVKPLTIEERKRIFLGKMEEKKKLVAMQGDKEAIETAQKELAVFKEYFNQRIKMLQEDSFDRWSAGTFMSHTDRAYFSIGDYQVGCNIMLPDRMRERIVTTQDFRIHLKFSKIFGNGQSEKILEEEHRLFHYNPPLNGWSVPYLHEQYTDKEVAVLFRNRDNSQRYDLVKPMATSELIDEWFHKLLEKATAEIGRYI